MQFQDFVELFSPVLLTADATQQKTTNETSHQRISFPPLLILLPFLTQFHDFKFCYLSTYLLIFLFTPLSPCIPTTGPATPTCPVVKSTEVEVSRPTPQPTDYFVLHPNSSQ